MPTSFSKSLEARDRAVSAKFHELKERMSTLISSVKGSDERANRSVQGMSERVEAIERRAEEVKSEVLRSQISRHSGDIQAIREGGSGRINVDATRSVSPGARGGHDTGGQESGAGVSSRSSPIDGGFAEARRGGRMSMQLTGARMRSWRVSFMRSHRMSAERVLGMSVRIVMTVGIAGVMNVSETLDLPLGRHSDQRTRSLRLDV